MVGKVGDPPIFLDRMVSRIWHSEDSLFELSLKEAGILRLRLSLCSEGAAQMGKSEPALDFPVSAPKSLAQWDGAAHAVSW